MDCENWILKHPAIFQSEIKAIKEQFDSSCKNLRGAEVGLGTGRYSLYLGINEGVESSLSMVNMARKKGIKVLNGVAEKLPYKDSCLDFILIITIYQLHDIRRAFKEAHRVLKKEGQLIVAFIDKNGPLRKKYEQKSYKSAFTRQAKFYSVREVDSLLKKSGFHNLSYTQTIFSEFENSDEIQCPREGFGEGSFIVVKAKKKQVWGWF